MMIMIAPAQPELVLPKFLDPRSAVAALPVGAFRLEEQFAAPVASNRIDRAVENPAGLFESVAIVGEGARTGLPKLPGFHDSFQGSGSQRGGHKTSVGMAFDGFQ